MVSLSTMLCRLSTEIANLSERAARLEAIVPSSTISRTDKLDSDTITDLQEFDTLIQSLGALSKFLEKLKEQLSPDQMVDLNAALEEMHLEEVANRLSGISTFDKRNTIQKSKSDPELF